MIFKGDSVQFLGGWTEEQIQWAETCAPTSLTVNAIYIAETIEVKPWATRIKLVGIDGVFNSTHFRVV